MDGISLNRLPQLRPTLAAGGAANAPVQSLADVRADLLQLSGNAAAGGAQPSASTKANVSLIFARISQDANAAAAAGDLAGAQRLVNFGGLLTGLGNNPAAGLLAAAYANPNGSDSARRLANAFLGESADPVNWTGKLLAFDGPEGAQLRQALPNSIFNSGVHTGQELVAAMVREIGNPSMAYQGSLQTCGATTVQGMLADQQPGEYIRLVATLAEYGKAQLVSGPWIARAADWEFQGDGNRAVTGRLLQPAFMAEATGGTYRNSGDVSNFEGHNSIGLQASQMTQLLADVTGRMTQEADTQLWTENATSWTPGVAGDQLQAIAGQLARGIEVPVLMKVQPNESLGHFERVTAVTATSITLANPRGYMDTLDLATFRERLVAAFYL